MNNEKQFNKEEFAHLLERAKGDRSINNFANETGVSAAHISRFLRKMIASPPTPETISKFAAKAYNEVTYHDLMIAAGHIARLVDFEEKINNIVKDSPMYLKNKGEVLEKKFIQVILAELYEKPIKWSIEKPEGKIKLPDMTLKVDYEGYNKWYLDFYPNVLQNRGPSFKLGFVYGSIAMYELLETDKISIVVNDEKDFNMIIKRPPLSIRANLYVMLIDLELGKILKEEMLCNYYKE
jgi:transcriptional regulator with XRE-family HTH domain